MISYIWGFLVRLERLILKSFCYSDESIPLEQQKAMNNSKEGDLVCTTSFPLIKLSDDMIKKFFNIQGYHLFCKYLIAIPKAINRMLFNKNIKILLVSELKELCFNGVFSILNHQDQNELIIDLHHYKDLKTLPQTYTMGTLLRLKEGILSIDAYQEETFYNTWAGLSPITKLENLEYKHQGKTIKLDYDGFRKRLRDVNLKYPIIPLNLIPLGIDF